MAKRQYNQFQILSNGTAEIYLPHEKVALVDWNDLPKVLPFTWFTLHGGTRWYAVTSITTSPYKTKILLMHRIISEPPNNLDTDHINGNGLDNRRCNLRFATRSQNSANQRKREKKTISRFKGIRLIRRTNHWCGQICIEGRRMHLGVFDKEEEAALAYNKAAVKYFGEFARLNEI